MSKTLIILKKNIRIYVTDLTSLVNKRLKETEYKPFPAIIFATSLVVFSPLALMQKQGEVKVNYKTEGAIKDIIIEGNSNGEIRALISKKDLVTEYDEEIKKVNTIPLQIATGKQGQLNVTKIVNDKSFGGKVDIIKGDFVSDLVYYLNKSEQIYSASISDVKLKSNNELERAYGVIFQLLPNSNDEDIKWIEDFMKTRMSEYKDIEEYINKIDGKIVFEQKITWKCKCSKEKMDQIVSMLSPKEKQKIIEEHGYVEIVCQFCYKKYKHEN